MTPCEKLGYKVGDKFEVLKDIAGFRKGETVILFEDDGTQMPLFEGRNTIYSHCGGEGGVFLPLFAVKHINSQPEQPEQPNDQEDRIFDALEKQGHFTNLQKSDGSTASYYELPEGATELQDLIGAKDMNYFIGVIFTLCYDYCRYRNGDISLIKEIKNAAEYEIARLQDLQKGKGHK